MDAKVLQYHFLVPLAQQNHAVKSPCDMMKLCMQAPSAAESKVNIDGILRLDGMA